MFRRPVCPTDQSQRRVNSNPNLSFVSVDGGHEQDEQIGSSKSYGLIPKSSFSHGSREKRSSWEKEEKRGSRSWSQTHPLTPGE
jgi:hypothetical protein